MSHARPGKGTKGGANVGQGFYTGKVLEDFLNKQISNKQLSKKYEMREAQVRSKRSKLRRKAVKKIGEYMEREPTPDQEIDGVPIDKLAGMLGEMLTEYGLNQDDIASISSVEIRDGEHVGMAVNRDTGEIETVALPNKRRKIVFKPVGRGEQLSDFISQADPVKITPSRRKPAKRDHDVIVVFSDTQIGYMDIRGDGELTAIHDEGYIEVVRQVCREFQPEFIVDTSDTVDFSNISRFPSDSNRFNVSLNHSINRAHRMYAELRADNPTSRLIAVDSNHTERLAKHLMKQAPELYGLRQAGSDSQYGALTYPFLLNLEAVDVEWYGGYRGARYVHGEENGTPIVFKHGESAVNNGSTAAKESKENPETHVVRGHSHRAELFHRTNRAGEYLTSMIIGCGCHTTGLVPSYHSSVDSNGEPNHYQENWSQSIGLIHDYKDGSYDFNHIMVNRGLARYGALEFNANEE